tara:strand:- start:471 stop:1514 length:1044 start_codon:yes stop_codon:yes gene_type:complete
MSEQVIEKELQEMELPSQSKTKANAAAKPGDPAPKAGSNASNVQTPGNSASYQDLGGPTVDNNKPDDDSNKLSSGSGVTQSSTASNSGKHSGGSGDGQDSTTKNKYLYNSVDWSADVDALVGTEELSEEFKEKAKTIFEAAINGKLAKLSEELEEHYATKFEEELKEAKTELTEKVDATLQYAAEEWKDENSLAIESGVKSEIAESFMDGLKSLFEEHYVTIPEEKYDAFDTMVEKLDDMEQKLNEQIEKNIGLTKEISESRKQIVVDESARGLTETQKDKFHELVEGVDFESEESYRGKIETIRESYFKSEVPQVKSDEQEVLAEGNVETTASMDSYLRAVTAYKK